MLRSLFLFFLIAIHYSGFSQALPVIIQNGNAKLAAADFQGAEKDFANAIRLNESVTTAYLDKLKKYGTFNDYQKSTSDMPDGFVYNHDYAVPYFGHGMSLVGLGKKEDALLDFEKAIAIDPKYADALCERGIILINTEAKDKGCMDLRKAKVLGNAKAKELYEANFCSDMSDTFIASGDTKMGDQDFAGALADYTAAVQLNSDSIHPYLKRAQCQIALKKYDKAISDYNKALKIKRDTVSIILLRGLAYNAAANYKLAFADLSSVIKLNPNSYEAFMGRGATCEGMENYRSAMYDYSEAIRIKPKDGQAYYKRGLINQDSKDYSHCKDFKIAASLGVEDAKALATDCVPPVIKEK